jgi:hypothetical protein
VIYIGIDNGLTGGLVALSDYPGPPIQSWPMPIKAKGKGNEVDSLALWNMVSKYGMTSFAFGITVIIETPGKHSPGALALCSMWDSFGAIRGVLESRGVRHHRVDPQVWQKAMLGKVEKGQTKPAAFARARQLWPDEDWLATPRSTKPHEGLIDAALIAEYGRRNNL